MLFRKWAAVAIIAGALERRVWLNLNRRVLYPNMYMILVGGPGVGKTDSLREVVRFWTELPGLHVAPSSVSRASLADALFSAERSILRPAELVPFTKFNSLQVCAEEFGTFLSQYETEFMSTLNHLYDCIRYSEKKRSIHKGEERIISNPQLSIIAATTPAWLSGTLPQTAWAEGFASRLVLVYSGERLKINPFKMTAKDEALESALVSDIKSVFELFGEFKITTEALDAFSYWYENDCEPVPEHPRLEHYIPRRHVHFLKLCLVFSVARGNDLTITIEDYQNSMDLLLETEALMPDVFRAMRYNEDASILDEAFNFVYIYEKKEGNPIAESRIYHFISQRAPAHSVSQIIKTMTDARMIRVANVCGPNGRPTYTAVPRIEHGT